MAVRTVAAVDNRYVGHARRHERSAVFGVTHGDDVGEFIDGHYGVGKRLAFRYRRGACIRESENITAEFEHRGLEAEAGARTGFVEESGQRLVLASFSVSRTVCDDVEREINNLLQFLHAQVGDVDKVMHNKPVL